MNFHVLDRCATPLNRITASIELSDPPAEVILDDILTYVPEHPFDIIFADSFLKQFPCERKAEVIDRLKTILAPKGVVVFREYLGALSQLLSHFWEQLDERLSAVGWFERAPIAAQRILRQKLPDLANFMKGIGSTYPSEEALLADIVAVGLRVESVDRVAGRPYIITTCRRVS